MTGNDDFLDRLRRRITVARDYARAQAEIDTALGVSRGGDYPVEVCLRGDDVDELERMLDATQAALDELHRLHDTKAEEYINATVGIREMRMVDGQMTMDLVAAREFTARLVAAARGMLNGAENYSETRVDFPPDVDVGLADASGAAEWKVGLAGQERYLIRIQRVGRLTPHDARRAAEAEADRLRAEIAALRAEAESSS